MFWYLVEAFPPKRHVAYWGRTQLGYTGSGVPKKYLGGIGIGIEVGSSTVTEYHGLIPCKNLVFVPGFDTPA